MKFCHRIRVCRVKDEDTFIEYLNDLSKAPTGWRGGRVRGESTIAEELLLLYFGQYLTRLLDRKGSNSDTKSTSIMEHSQTSYEHT